MLFIGSIRERLSIIALSGDECADALESPGRGDLQLERPPRQRPYFEHASNTGWPSEGKKGYHQQQNADAVEGVPLFVTVQACKSRVAEIFKNLQFGPGS